MTEQAKHSNLVVFDWTKYELSRVINDLLLSPTVTSSECVYYKNAQ